MYGHTDAVFRQRPDGHTFLCKFGNFKWLYLAYYWVYLDQFVKPGHTCQPQNAKIWRLLEIFVLYECHFSAMSRNTPRKSPERPSECYRLFSVRTAFTYHIAIVPIIFNDKLLSDSKVLMFFQRLKLCYGMY